jgi:predicted phosphoribosyltransferase
MKFASRQDAGRRLGKYLRQQGVIADLVLGLPRGGVIVAAEVARELKLMLDVLVVRKIGHPFQREFAVGALAEPDVCILDELALAEVPVVRTQLDEVVAEETARLHEYRSRFHPSAAKLNGKAALLVDDGLATGMTAEAAAQSARKQGAQKIIIAAPAASTSALVKLRHVADEVFGLVVDPYFAAVGRYYENFDQTTDDEVVALLRDAMTDCKMNEMSQILQK